jgi:hypothetical protein
VNLQFDYDVVPFPVRCKRNIEGFRERLRRASKLKVEFL